MHEFFTLSKNDLRTSGILYDEKLYTNSLYHYHQGVEKAVKGICLSIGGISERDLKSISHDPLNAYKILTKYLVTKSEGLLSPFNEHLFTNLRQMLELQTEAEIVANARQLMNGVLNEEKTIKEEDFPTPFDALEDYINSVSPRLLPPMKNESMRLYVAASKRQESIDMINLLNYGIKVFHVIIINSLICCKYKPDEFRYPSRRLGNPLLYFQEDHPLVKDLHLFIETMDRSVKLAATINWG